MVMMLLISRMVFIIRWKKLPQRFRTRCMSHRLKSGQVRYVFYKRQFVSTVLPGNINKMLSFPPIPSMSHPTHLSHPTNSVTPNIAYPHLSSLKKSQSHS